MLHHRCNGWKFVLAAFAFGGAAMTGPLKAEVPADSPVADALRKADAAIAAIAKVPDDKRNFDNTIAALDDALAHLDTDTALTQFMAYVSTDAKEREAGQTAEEQVANWKIDLFKRDELAKAIKGYAQTNPKLEGEQKKLLSEMQRELRRAGMELPAEKREELTRIKKEITRLGIAFEGNIRDDATRIPFTKEELAGMPESFFQRPDLQRSGDLYLIGMDAPTYVPITESCSNETTRHKLWVTYKRRVGQKNVDLLEQILKLRSQVASMLGYATFADYETEVGMAKNAKAVQDFYDKLRPIVRKKAKLDFAEFQDAKRKDTGNPDAKLQAWDQPYYENWLRRERYAVDSEKVKEYFPMEAVVNGLFSITQALYGLEYRDVTAQAASKGYSLWHPDVKLYEVWDKASNQLLGHFFIDLYPRDNKYTHFACWGLHPRKRWPDGSVQKPLAAMVCNFPKPTGDKPALMPHKDVETFFHEFGHCLHNILTEANYAWFAGTAVARDFVEAPSQMFEDWVWDAKVLKTFARHYKTGEPIPDELVASMIKAKNLGKGLWCERQFFYGLTSLSFHMKPDGVVDTTKEQERLAGEIEQFDPVPNTCYQAAFGHLIGYGSGYYSYMWSLVYAADMAQRFEELGMLNPEAGAYYRKKILARGSTIDELDMVKDYLGREPKMDAFLKDMGLE